MDNMNLNNRPENQENERGSFVKGLGIFAISLFLAVVTVLIISL